MFYKLKDPPQWLLDGLYAEEIATSHRPCHDCGAKPGYAHKEGCDTARCLNTGIQRLQCDCGKCGADKWTGMWPGIQECYDQKLVCFDTASSSIGFDLNEQAIRHQKELQQRGNSTV